jgi:tetratricopeptide (TPR) repeat protein
VVKTGTVVTKSWKRKGQSALKAWRFVDAKQFYECALSQDRGDAETLARLAMVEFRLGNVADAEQRYTEAQRSRCRSADAFVATGTAHLLFFNYQSAQQAFYEALAIEPGSISARDGLARTLARAGNLGAALQVYRTLIGEFPRDIVPWLGMGQIFAEAGQTTEAARCLLQAEQIDSNAFEIHEHLGRLYLHNGQISQAVSRFETAISNNPVCADAHLHLGYAYLFQRQMDDAINSFRNARQQSADHPDAVAGEASVYVAIHEIERAYELVLTCIRRNVLNPAIAGVFLSVCQKCNNCDEAARYAEQVLALPILARDAKIGIHLALGRNYDAAGRFDDAFQQFDAGNSLDVPAYVPATREREVSTLIESFGAAARLSGRQDNQITSQGHRMVFIVGMPRSGTTLVEQILASHSRVHAGGELPYLHEIVAQILRPGTSWIDALRSLDQQRLDVLAKQYLSRIGVLPASLSVITDKMWSNFDYLGLIALMFPDARIIHCVRDPLDTGISIYAQNFSGRVPFASNLTHIGHFYRQYIRLMERWHATAPLPILDVHYESLVRDPRVTVQSLLEFCGLDWDDRCLEFHRHDRIAGTASEAQVRQPLYQTSVCRWRHYASQLEPLRAALCAADEE